MVAFQPSARPLIKALRLFSREACGRLGPDRLAVPKLTCPHSPPPQPPSDARPSTNWAVPGAGPDVEQGLSQAKAGGLHARATEVVEHLNAMGRQSVRTASAARLRVEGPDLSLQPLPRGQPIHALEKRLPAGRCTSYHRIPGPQRCAASSVLTATPPSPPGS